MRNKGIGCIEIILILAVIIVLLGILISNIDTDPGDVSAKGTEATTGITTETTTEVREEPKEIEMVALYGPDAGVVKTVSLEEDTTEVSAEFEELIKASFEEEPTVEVPTNIYNLSIEDQYLLTALAMCEAGGEDIEGKALVINVVLNRVADSRYPNTVHDVIYQSGQFTPAMNGVLSSTAGDNECWAALDMVNVEGWDESNGAIYFCASYVDFGWATYLFQHGGHKFYK